MSISLVINSWAIVISFIPGRKIRRSTLGRSWNPILAPHQSSRRSHIFFSTSVWTSRYGPVTTGQPFAGS